MANTESSQSACGGVVEGKETGRHRPHTKAKAHLTPESSQADTGHTLEPRLT